MCHKLRLLASGWGEYVGHLKQHGTPTFCGRVFAGLTVFSKTFFCRAGPPLALAFQKKRSYVVPQVLNTPKRRFLHTRQTWFFCAIFGRVARKLKNSRWQKCQRLRSRAVPFCGVQVPGLPLEQGKCFLTQKGAHMADKNAERNTGPPRMENFAPRPPPASWVGAQTS